MNHEPNKRSSVAGPPAERAEPNLFFSRLSALSCISSCVLRLRFAAASCGCVLRLAVRLASCVLVRCLVYDIYVGSVCLVVTYVRMYAPGT